MGPFLQAWYLHLQICEGWNFLKYSLRQGGEAGEAQDQPVQVCQILKHSLVQGEDVVLPQVAYWVLRERDGGSREDILALKVF